MGRANKKHNHAANLNLILNELRKTSPDGGLTLKELAELCGVSTRNIYRYLNEIEEMGFDLVRPMQTKPGSYGQGKYRLRNKTLPETRIDTNLMMIIGLNAQRQLQYQEHLRIINEFFIKYLAAKYNLSLPSDWKLPSTHQLINEPKNSKQTTSTKAVLQNININPTKHRNPEKVKIVISASAAETYKKYRAPFKVILEEELSDGSLLLTFELTNPTEIFPWIFQWNGDAEIVEPLRLRSKLTEFCNSVIKAHHNKYLSRKISYMDTTKII